MQEQDKATKDQQDNEQKESKKETKNQFGDKVTQAELSGETAASNMVDQDQAKEEPLEKY